MENLLPQEKGVRPVISNPAGSDILAPDGRGNWRHCREGSTSPKTNRAFWDRKRETNTARDKCVTRQLRGRGWKFIRVWQLPSAVYAALRLSVSPEACLTCIRRGLTLS